jgi:hypothetical protein
LNEIVDVLTFRLPYYQAAADLSIVTDSRPAVKIAELVTNAWLDWRNAGGRRGEGSST